MPKYTWTTGFHQIGPDIFCYITEGTRMLSNCLLVAGKESALLFDVLATRSMTEEFLSECRKYTDKPIRYLVLSHCHGDHFLGAKAVSGATVIGHTSLKAAFDLDKKSGRLETMKARTPNLDFTDAVFPYPQIYLSEGCAVDLGERIVEIRALGKCHTIGDLSLYIPDAGVMALADVLFYGIVPATISGDLDHWIKVLAELENGEAKYFLPGHGPMCGKAEVTTLRKYLEAVCQQARDVAAGKLQLEDEIPSPVEMKMIEAGWQETARTLFSTEQYLAKISGVPFRREHSQIIKLETERNQRFFGKD